MTSAAFFLITHNLKNRFMRSVGRLRQPRYVVGALFAVGYFWTLLFRKGAMGNIQHLRHGPGNEMMVIFTSVLALLILIAPWALPGNAPGLVFSEAEIQFLFAGPVSRRQLLAFKVLRTQVQSLFSAVLFSLFAFRGSHILGMWLAFAVLDVYSTFVSFARARLKLSGVGWAWRFTAVAILVMVIGSIANHQFQGQADLLVKAFRSSRQESVVDSVRKIVWAPPLGSILFVPAVFARTIYAPAPYASAALLAAFGLALFFLTTQFDISFEDASIVASQRALTRRARMRGRRSGRSTAAVRRFPPLFQLAETGRAEVALLWKNLIGIMRISSVPWLVLFIPVIFGAAIAIFGRKHGMPDALGMMGLMLTAAFVFIGPQAVRVDLRTDILRLDVIKAFPLSAESLIAAELAAPLLIISAIEFVTLLVSVVALQFGGHYFDFFTTPEFVVCAFVFIVPVIAIQLLIQNGAVVMFPAWSMPTETRGFGVMGQRLLFLLGNLVTLAIALIPAAIVFAPSFWLAHKLQGSAPLGLVLATTPAVAVLLGEIYVAHQFVAAQFDDIDIANDIDAVTE